MNIWRSDRKGYRMIATWVGITVCSIWIYYFSYNMNLIPSDCWYIIAKQKSTGAEQTVLNHRNNTGLGSSYEIAYSSNVSYDFRLVCVLGITCWSLLIFLSCTQVLKPLHVLIAMTMPYIFTAFIWWYYWCYNVIYSEAAKSCSSFTELSKFSANFNSMERDLLYQQGKFMTRWFLTFSIMAGIFLLGCLPFSTYFLVLRIINDRTKRIAKEKRDRIKQERYAAIKAQREERRKEKE
jgi:hypothetical protein